MSSKPGESNNTSGQENRGKPDPGEGTQIEPNKRWKERGGGADTAAARTNKTQINGIERGGGVDPRRRKRKGRISLEFYCPSGWMHVRISRLHGGGLDAALVMEGRVHIGVTEAHELSSVCEDANLRPRRTCRVLVRFFQYSRTMGGKRKNRACGKTPSSKGRRGRKSVAAPSPVAIEAPEPAASSVMVTPSPVGTVKLSAVKEEVVVNLDFSVPMMVLKCDVCHHLLKAPIFQCSLLRHVVCRSCSELHGGKCRPCADLAASAVYVQSSYLDTLFGYIKAPCPFKKYGCTSSTAIGYPAIAHAVTCAFMPRLCPKCSFEGSLGDLVRHLAEEYGRHEHDWTAQKITYGQEYLLRVDELDPQGSYDYDFFVAEEDGCVFLLFSDLTKDFQNSIFPFVTLVCVRNSAAAAAGPVYSYWVAAEAPPAARRKLMPEINEVLSCSDWELERDCLPLPPGMLLPEVKSRRMCICISKTESSSASC